MALHRSFAAAALLVLQVGSRQQQAGVERVGWQAGCWELASAERTIEEHWLPPRGGSMIGIGRTVREGRMTEYEFVVLRPQEGRLAYEAHPSGQPSAVFLSKTLTDSSVVFENAAHDFPQRIG